MEKSIFTEWCIVEMMGHRRIAGHVTERTIAGHGFLEVRIPSEPPIVQMIQPSSIYAMTPCTEETARAYAKTLSPGPLTLFDARRMLAVDAPPASQASPPWRDTYGSRDDDDMDDDPNYDYAAASPIQAAAPTSGTLPNANVDVVPAEAAGAMPETPIDPNEVLF